MKPDALICHPGPINRGRSNCRHSRYMARSHSHALASPRSFSIRSMPASLPAWRKLYLLRLGDGSEDGPYCLRTPHVIDSGRSVLNETGRHLLDGATGRSSRSARNLAMETGRRARTWAARSSFPGLVDIHVHAGRRARLRAEGGHRLRHGAPRRTGGLHGGDCAARPNTKPVIDNAVGVEYVKARAAAVGQVPRARGRLLLAGAQGDTLSEMGDMVAHGAVAFTDDGRGVQGAGMMRRVMDYAAQFDRVVMSHCQDEDLVGAGQVNEGVVSTRLGMLGWPAEGEEIQIARDIAICRLTGCPLHIQHLTTARGPGPGARRQGRGPAGHLRGHAAPPVPHRGTPSATTTTPSSR